MQKTHKLLEDALASQATIAEVTKANTALKVEKFELTLQNVANNELTKVSPTSGTDTFIRVARSLSCKYQTQI